MKNDTRINVITQKWLTSRFLCYNGLLTGTLYSVNGSYAVCGLAVAGVVYGLIA